MFTFPLTFPPWLVEILTWSHACHIVASSSRLPRPFSLIEKILYFLPTPICSGQALAFAPVVPCPICLAPLPYPGLLTIFEWWLLLFLGIPCTVEDIILGDNAWTILIVINYRNKRSQIFLFIPHIWNPNQGTKWSRRTLQGALNLQYRS